MDFSPFRDTGELSDLTVVVDKQDFNLHRFPLYIKSDFFRALARNKPNQSENQRVELAEFPGGADTFILVANYYYNIKIDVTKENVYKLRCAAEFLQMTSPGNLASVTDRFLQDTLTSAKLGRSMNTVLDLLFQCCDLGPIAEQANIVDKCIQGIVDCWLISSKYTKRTAGDYVSVDPSTMKRLCKLPLAWFLKLFKVARDKNVRPALLATLIQMYINHAMEKLADDGKQQEVPVENGTAEGEDGKEKTGDKTENGTEAEGETPAADNDAKDNMDEKSPDTTAKKEETKAPEVDPEDKNTADISEVLDALLPELPENANLAETMSPEWAIHMLKTTESLGDESRKRVLKLAGILLPRFTSEQLGQLSPDLFCSILKEVIDGTGNEDQNEALGDVTDAYLLELAGKDELTVDVYKQILEIMPGKQRTCHDNLFKALELLLNSEKIKVSEDEKQNLLETVDFSLLSESTLQRAYDSNLVPGSYITKAALNLCTKLRSDLETAKSIVASQELELEKYGLGGKGSAWLKTLEPGSGKSKCDNSEPALGGGTSDLDVRLALDAFHDQQMEGSLGSNSYAPYSYTYGSSYMDGKDSGIDANDIYRQSRLTTHYGSGSPNYSSTYGRRYNYKT